MMNASECVGELLERIAARVGVDARLERKEDAEGVRAEYVGEDPGLVIAHHRGHEAHPFSQRRRSPSGRWTLPRGARRLDCCSARQLHEYAATRMRLSPWAKDQARGITAPFWREAAVSASADSAAGVVAFGTHRATRPRHRARRTSPKE
jgi:hypothetical protein